MVTATQSAGPRGLAPMLAWRRLRFALGAGLCIGLLFSLGWETSLAGLFIRTVGLAFIAMLVFGLFEQWPRRLPGWLPRWVLQVVAVGVAMPVSTFCIYVYSTKAGAPPFWEDPKRLEGFMALAGIFTLTAPWAALAALVRQKDALARHQALAFELERSELERQALDSRLRLLQAQIEPHFLFNTLANVRELVQAGSPQAPAVLDSLIAYLRAAVPRLHEPATTLGQELELVRAYLELMHMRIPDRLQFIIDADEAAPSLICPPMTLLTLVENAVRHGIDPSEEGGRIEVRVRVQDGHCRAQVLDTGVGLKQCAGGLGTGLTTLRERLQLVFGGGAELRLHALQPHGTSAELDFPARRSAAPDNNTRGAP